MNWAFYSPLRCPLEEFTAAGDDRREAGSESDRRLGGEWGGEAGGPGEQAGHPRPAREAGWAEPWAARPRPAVAMEPGRGRGPGRSAGAGSVARGSAGAAGEAASLAHRRLCLRGCSVSRGRAWRKPLEALGPLFAPRAAWAVRPKGGLVQSRPPGLPPFAPTSSRGAAKGGGVLCLLLVPGPISHGKASCMLGSLFAVHWGPRGPRSPQVRSTALAHCLARLLAASVPIIVILHGGGCPALHSRPTGACHAR